MSTRFAHGVTLQVHRYDTGPRGVLLNERTHSIPGAGVGRPRSDSGAFPVNVPETSRQVMVRDYDVDVRDRDYVTFPDGHRLSDTWWQVRGEVQDYLNPFTGWRAGVTFRIERDNDPGVV